MVVGQKQITLAELLAMPEEKPELELMDGEVTSKKAPVTEHVVLQLQFRDLVDDFARPRKLDRAFPELRESYAEASTTPDVSVYTWDRLPRSPSGGRNNDVRTPPDLAFEVRSPSQNPTDVLVRCLWYVANGAGWRSTPLRPAGRGVSAARRAARTPGDRRRTRRRRDSCVQPRHRRAVLSPGRRLTASRGAWRSSGSAGPAR